MMEDHEFCDDCLGCKPALVDSSGKALPLDSPEMKVVMFMWENDTTYQERKAFIEVTLHNSELPSDVRLATSVFSKIKKALSELSKVMKQEPF